MTDDSIEIFPAGPNEAPISELFAFLSFDDKGNEGIVAALFAPLGSTPLVTSKQRIAEIMKGPAGEVARVSGRPVRLVRFTRADVMWSGGVQ